jgi:hypothetical protein
MFDSLRDAAHDRFGRFVVLLAVLSSAPLPAATVVPDAFTELLSLNSEGEQLSLGTTPGAQQGQVSGFADFGSAIASGSASAQALGFFSPIISPNNIPGLGRATAVARSEHLLTGTGPPRGVGIADAAIDFYIFLGLEGSAPGVNEVPVNIRATGIHNVSVPTGSGSGTGQAQVVVEKMLPGGAGVGGFSLDTTDSAFGGFFSETRQMLLAPGDILRVLLRANAHARAAGGDTLVTASVDPSFMIPLDFPQRDSFAFVDAAQIPEPSTLVTGFAGAVIIVGMYVLKRLRWGHPRCTNELAG